MAKIPPRHRKEWTDREVRELHNLADQNTPTRVIGLKLGRTEDAVRQKASDEGISLRPTNHSPYGRRKLEVPHALSSSGMGERSTSRLRCPEGASERRQFVR